MSRASILSALTSASLLVLFAAGCKSASAPTPENFTKGLTKFLAEHPDCLYKTALRFPYETSDSAEVKQLDALVAAKLLTKGTEPAIHISRYSVSDYGQKSAPRFCYGFRRVTGIDSFTPPAKAADGFNESKVVYRYAVQDVPVWAKDADVQKVYPDLVKSISDPAPATITMAQTGVGWQVPD